MKLIQIRDDTRGSALVEFTVTIPLFLLLMFGIAQAGLLLFTQSGLQHGVERAARCASVNYAANQIKLTQSCFIVDGVAVAPKDVTDSTIKDYARQNSWGMGKSGFIFTVDSPPATCGTNSGYVVTGKYSFVAMKYIFSGTLTAQSCFPIRPS
jgi:Flp pilus assembly protein TadG